MADTLKFGPEWLRQLSGGNSVGTPPPSPAPGFGKYKLAEYRYGREEMLALFTPSTKIPEEISQYTAIVTEKAQDPLAFVPFGEEEQRIMSQSVNSMAVMRMMGRGAPPVRGGRGGTVDRGRGRGRGRGDGFMRGMSYDEGEVGFGRARPRQDGWEEAGAKRFERSFSSRYDETGLTQQGSKIYQRSLSSDNWRDREEEEDENSWRKAGPKWNMRGNWREVTGRGGGFDYERGHPATLATRGAFSRQYQRSRSSESWEEEDVPEWSTPDINAMEELGTFDSSGAFVSTKPPFHMKGKRRDFNGDRLEEIEQESYKEAQDEESKQSVKTTDTQEADSKDINQNKTKTKAALAVESGKKDRVASPKVNSAQEKKDETEAKQSDQSKRSNSSKKPVSKSETVTQTKSQSEKSPARKAKNNSEKTVPAKNNASVTFKEEPGKVSPRGNVSVAGSTTDGVQITGGKKTRSEDEALEQMKDTAEQIMGFCMKNDDEEEYHEGVRESNLAVDHENYSKWFYRDPQGDLQGPFTPEEMGEWFSAGYFTMNLTVRRGCDEVFSPLGELIKLWGRVPFLPGPFPRPLMKHHVKIREEQEKLQAQMQQQMLMQQQLVQQQMMMRHMQIQQLVHKLQENETFKALPAIQQQQIAMQTLLKQELNLHPSQPQMKLPRSSPSEMLAPPPSTEAQMSTSPHPSFHRSLSTPNSSQGPTPPHHHTQQHPDNLSPSVSIWDDEPMAGNPNMLGDSMGNPNLTGSDLTSHLQKDKQRQAEEKKYQEELERKQEELKKQQEEIQRQKEEMDRQRQELERKRQIELKKVEEEKRKAEEERTRLEEKKKEEEKRLKDEERRRQEDVRRRQEEELRRQQEEERRRQEEQQRQQMLVKQQLEAQKRQEMEELEKQKQVEIERRQTQEAQRQQEIQRQQEALRKLQQEQLAHIQLPAHAQWGSGSNGQAQTTQQHSLLEIQQIQEQKDKIEREEMQRQHTEAQRQHILSMQHQQQQQKSWSNAIATKQANTTKSLLEIQEEQARQLERERLKREENQQQAAKNMSISTASVWNASSPQGWASEGAWGNVARSSPQQAQNQSNNNSNSLGFWDDAIISSSVAPAPAPAPVSAPPQQPNKKQSNKQGKGTAEFPALGGGSVNASKSKTAQPQNKQPQNKQPKQLKSTKKEEEAVQRLFQSVKPMDEFTQWCETTLKSMATSVDIPTFIAFLQEVDSPYEVHDYVRSYLGESRTAIDFGKQFLEKRSHYRNKSKPVQEDSIWGPAPAITPRELRHNPSSSDNDGQKSKSSKKKKNKMMKVDASILGFTVHAAPDRMVGEIENVEVPAGTGTGAR